MYDFKDKIVLITGASRRRGIGHTSAVRFAKEGADVVLVARARSIETFPESERLVGWKGLESVAEEVRAQGRRAVTIDADVTKSGDVQAMVEKAVEAFGRIDILINNAGIGGGGAPVVELAEDSWNNVMNVNLNGTFLCSKYVARHMIERGGGAIVHVASRAAKVVMPRSSAYSVSKAAIVALTQVMAIELAPYKIRVNAVCPGRVATNMGGRDRVWRLMQDEGLSYEQAVRKANADVLPFTPMDRIAEPEEVAAVIAFLASDESSYMTGQAINVTGGRVMH